MKKVYTTILLAFSLVLMTQAQGWVVYDADVLPDAFTPAFTESNYSGVHATDSLIDDPDNPGNKLLQFLSTGDASRDMWKHSFEDPEVDSLTLIMRFKGVDETLDRVMEIDLQQAGFRERIYIYSDNTFKLNESGLEGDLTGNVMDWHIYRLTKVGDSVRFYFDENPEPFGVVKTLTASTENYYRFGDGNGSSTLGALIDWIVWDTTGAYAPGTGTALPDTLVDVTPGWKVYAGNENPLDSDPAFVTSNLSGNTDTNTFHTVIPDPGHDGNNIFEERTTVETVRYQFRYTFPDPTNAMTFVGRMRGVYSDTMEYDRVMEIDLDMGGFRERLYINTDSTIRLNQSGLTDTLDAGVYGWHIYRLTKTGDSVNFYFDENPEPIASVITPNASTNNYFRFGDGNGSITLGAQIDWIIWDESGAYAPGRGNFIPDSLILEVSSADLASITVDQGTLAPAFHKDSLEYEVVLPVGTTSVNVDAVAADASATIEGLGDVDVTSGSGTATIVVTASDMINTKTYSVNFTVEEEPLSNDANLASITTNVGSLDPAFDANTTAYSLAVPASTVSVTLTATANDEAATVAGDGEITTLPGTAEIVVTAEDGTTKTYTVNITKLVSSLPQLSESDLMIYPNPFTDKIMISSGNRIHEVSIFDVTGKEVLNQKVDAGTAEISTDLNAGIYFIKIQTDQGVIINKITRE